MKSMSLPSSWAETKLGAILTAIIGGGTPSKGNPDYFQGDIPLMTVKDMRDRRPRCTGFNITQEGLDNSSARVVPADTVIIATRMGLGKVVRAPFETAINQDLKALFPAKGVEKSYLELWFQSITGKLENMGTGTTVKGLRLNTLKELNFPLAPVPEQCRIVDKVEKLFIQLDKGEEALTTVQRQLQLYRQSVLKAAISGELTRDWREANKDRLEPASKLLDRILQTRRETWSGRGKYKEPVAPDTSDLPSLPEGWTWVSVDQLLRSGLSNGRSVPDAQEGFPVLRLTALQDGRVEIAERKIGAWSASAATPYLIQRGDILVSRGNGSKKLVGRGGLVAEDPDPVAYPDTMIRIPILLNVLWPEWFLYMWNSPFMRGQIEGAAKTTAGIYKINQTDIRFFRVPLPPIMEQEEISRKIDLAFERVTILEKWCGTELSRSEVLRQSILREAFTGQLVPQDSDDEPASELLTRIKADQGKSSAKTRRKAQA